MMKVGLIGCGSIARKHVQSLLKEQDISLVAVADTVSANMQKIVQQCADANRVMPNQFSDYHELLAQPDVDTVVVAVPSGLHAQIAGKALAHGKHVVIEKPMALSMKDARMMRDMANQTGRCLVVCHQKRFYPHLQHVHHALELGMLGKIVLAEASLIYNRNDEYYQAARWRGTWAMDGGILLNQGIHNIDLLVWLMGVPSQVSGYLSRQLRQIETEDTAAAIMRQPDGALMILSSTVCAHPQASCERIAIFGTRGHIELEGKRLEHILCWDVEGIKPPVFEEIDPYGCLYRDLHHAITYGTRPLVDGAEGCKTLQTVLAIYESHSKGTVVHLSDDSLSSAWQTDVTVGDSDV